ncbi:MAG: ABC transporter permease [Pacificimonas sp.]
MHDESGGAEMEVIRPDNRAGFLSLGELLAYRDLFRFLIWRGIKVRYAQSALGIGWAVLEPAAQVLVYTIVFGMLVGVQSDGEPYFLFVFAAIVPWTFFSNALTQATTSLSQNANLIAKVYFPRIILPFSGVGTRLVDFVIAFVLLIVLLLAYGIVPGWGLLVLPLLIGIMTFAALGLGLWLSALAIQYRDVNHGTGFAVQLLKYAAPVVYPATLVPAAWQPVYALNPMVGVVEGFRAALLGSRPMPWDMIGIGGVVAVLMFIGGAYYFSRREHLFADVG